MKIGQYFSDKVVGTSNWSNFDRLSRRAGLSAIAGLSCFLSFIVWSCAAELTASVTLHWTVVVTL